MQVQFPSVARDFSLRVNFQCRLSYAVCTLLCAITCIYISVLVKDPVVHVRVWLIMETLKHPACTLGLVAQLSQLAFPGEGNLNFPWEKSHWDKTVAKLQMQKYISKCHITLSSVTLCCTCRVIWCTKKTTVF